MNVTADIDVNDLATADRGKNEPLVGWRSFHVGSACTCRRRRWRSRSARCRSTDFHSRAGAGPDGGPTCRPRSRSRARRPRQPPGREAGARSRGPRALPRPRRPARRRADADRDRQAHAAGRPGHLQRSIDPARLFGGAQPTWRRASPACRRSRAPPPTSTCTARSTARARWRSPGKVNPLAKEIALDVQVSLKDIELPPASPYTGKYAGYAIGKGKLDLALAYKIAEPQARRAEQAGAGPVHVRRQGRQPGRGEAAGAPGGGAAQGSARRHRHRPADRGLARRSGVQDLARGPEGAGQPGGQGGHRAVLADRVGVRRRRRAVAHRLRRRASALDAAAQKRLRRSAKVAARAARHLVRDRGRRRSQAGSRGAAAVVYERKLKAKKLAALVQSGAAVALGR